MRRPTKRMIGMLLVAATLLTSTITSPWMNTRAFAAETKISIEAPMNLTVNNRMNPLGIDTHPQFAWDSRTAVQTAYQIQVAASENQLQAGDLLWDSGKVISSDDLQIRYNGPALQSATRYYWKVRVWDKAGKASTWSSPVWWETGLYDLADWGSAKWIGGRQPQDNDWTDMTATVKFRATNPNAGMTFLFHAQPIGLSTWTEAYSWQVRARTGNTTLFMPSNAGDTNIKVAATTNFAVGDTVKIGTGENQDTRTITSVGTQGRSTSLNVAAAAGATGIRVASTTGLTAGDVLTIDTGSNQESATIASIPSPAPASPNANVVLTAPLTLAHASGVAVRTGGTGITLDAALGSAHASNEAVVTKTKVELNETTNHYAGNTGVPGGTPEVQWGDNYLDPQSEKNPRNGTRTVPIAVISNDGTLGGITADNLTAADHELKVKVEGNTITTWVNGVQVDERTLSGDQLRSSGSIGFAGGSGVIIREVTVEPANPISSGSTNGFHTNFEGGANPFESGIPIWTGVQGDPSQDGLVIGSKISMLPISNPAPLLRKEFEIAGSPIASARLYVTGGGYPNVSINGTPVTTDGNQPKDDGSNIPHLIPDDAQADKTVLYNTFDITNFLKAGSANVIGVELGRAWTGVTIPNAWQWNLVPFHGDPKMLAKLVITHQDGSKQVIVTDQSWKTTDGPTTFDSVYSGEKYDARVAQNLGNWKQSGYDDSLWGNASLMIPVGSCTGPNPACHGIIPNIPPAPEGFVASKLKATEHEPILVRDTMQVSEIRETSPGSNVYLFKFDQMHTGWLRLNLTGITPDKAGLTIRMRADNMITGGSGTQASPYTLSFSNNFVAGDLQTDYFTLSEESTQTWAPSFHYNGQGAVEVYGLENVLGRAPSLPQDANLIVAEVASSGFPMTGSFDSSNDLLNRIKVMSNWTQLNNAHGHPTDTPSREKNGWTGDGWADEEAWIQDFDVSQFYTKWVRDIADSMISTGEISPVVPAPKGGFGYDQTPGWNAVWGSIPAWDHAFFEIPWDLYHYYGHTQLLQEIYPAQKKYLDYLALKLNANNGYTAASTSSLGEYATGVLGSGNVAIINHQLYYRMAVIMSNIASLLGNEADAASYRTLANDVLKVFISKYWDESKSSFQKPPIGNLETEQVMALAYDMVPGSDLDPSDPRYLAGTKTQAENKVSVAAVIADSIKGNNNRIGVGVYGLKYLFNILDEYGYTDLAYSVATGIEQPSWGNLLAKGSTTLQEFWNLIDGNHHYHSSIITWYYQGLAGIKPTSPGYRTIQIKPYVPSNTGISSVPPFTESNPQVTEPLTYVRAAMSTARGLIESYWSHVDGNFQLNVTIPSNTPAEIWVPTLAGDVIMKSPGAELLRKEKGYNIYKAGAGSYSFTVGKTSTEAYLNGPNLVGKEENVSFIYGLKEGNGVSAQDVTVKYDTTRFEFVKAESLAANTVIQESSNDDKAGSVRFVLASLGSESSLSGNVDVLKLTFKSKKTAGTGSIELANVILSNGQGALSQAAVAGKNVALDANILNNILGYDVGDVGVISYNYGKNAADPGWDAIKKADINGDGEVGLWDLGYIARKVLK